MFVTRGVIENGDRFELKLEPTGIRLKLFKHRISVPEKVLARGVECSWLLFGHQSKVEDVVRGKPITAMPELLRDYLGRGLDFDCPAQQFLFDGRIVGEIRDATKSISPSGRNNLTKLAASV